MLQPLARPAEIGRRADAATRFGQIANSSSGCCLLWSAVWGRRLGATMLSHLFPIVDVRPIGGKFEVFVEGIGHTGRRSYSATAIRLAFGKQHGTLDEIRIRLVRVGCAPRDPAARKTERHAGARALPNSYSIAGSVLVGSHRQRAGLIGHRIVPRLLARIYESSHRDGITAHRAGSRGRGLISGCNVVVVGQALY
jgi:hypothetical protein